MFKMFKFSQAAKTEKANLALRNLERAVQSGSRYEFFSKFWKAEQAISKLKDGPQKIFLDARLSTEAANIFNVYCNSGWPEVGGIWGHSMFSLIGLRAINLHYSAKFGVGFVERGN